MKPELPGDHMIECKEWYVFTNVIHVQVVVTSIQGPNFWLVDPYLSQEGGSTFGSKYVPGVHISLVPGMVQNFQGGRYQILQ